ncbi:MAG: transglycosylase domain-containing protein [Bdellovibrionaceae bacterium]|nr:transglycosylase domain-containing protein [Pseudobdellovibrionaceae bacterium]
MWLISRLFLVFLGITFIAALSLWLMVPSTEEIRGCLTTKMHKVHLCPGSKDYVPLNSISKYLRIAVVLTEDSKFWQHNGFDWETIVILVKEAWKTGKTRRGGSTITQQLAKNMFLTSEKTIKRKVVEALIAWRLEQNLSKKEILERYLNVIEFGPGVYGILKASAFYFGKAPSDLDAVESAFLAMVLPNPKKYSHSHKKKELTPFARRRLLEILSLMKNTRHLTEQDYHQALQKVDSLFSESGNEEPPEQEEDWSFF